MSKKLEEYTKEELIQLVRGLKTSKKFGLVWEDKPEEVERMCQSELPVLTEVSERKIIKNEGDNNLILEGDNYHSLSVLNYTHLGSIDLIYIDPPYNTGNEDFIYNDKYVDNEDGFRHSKWLSFMSKRLELAKNLLKADGMIFISIDDNEQANLKLLCDDIFGSENFINCISVKTKASSGASGGGEDKKLKKNVEYLLFYSKNRNFFNYKTTYVETELMDIIAEKREDGKQFEYKKILYNEGRKEAFQTIKDGSGLDIVIFKHSNYEIKSVAQIMKEEDLSEEQVYSQYFEKIFRGQPAQSSIRTRVNDATGNSRELFSIEYTPRSGKRKGQLATNYYINCDLVNWLSDTAIKTKAGVKKREKLGTLWTGFSWNGLSSQGGVNFGNGKKPVEFIKKIIEHHPKNDITVLDFFAGSGTTAEAVLNINREDNGSRKFIVCNNNADTKKEHKIAESVLLKRVKNVVEGYKSKQPIPSNVRYFRTDFVSKKKTSDQTRLALIDRCTDMIRVREDAYEYLINDEKLKLLSSNGHNAAIIFDPDHIDEYFKRIEEIDHVKPLNAYIFSYSSYTYDDDIPESKLQYTLCPIPESILEVYRRIFRENDNV